MQIGEDVFAAFARSFRFAPSHRIHFIGISGIGISDIAEILLMIGYLPQGRTRDGHNRNYAGRAKTGCRIEDR
jgi:UDP-N-acetylmuramate-alanine ligase